jgi:hypothetical protein
VNSDLRSVSVGVMFYNQGFTSHVYLHDCRMLSSRADKGTRGEIDRLCGAEVDVGGPSRLGLRSDSSDDCVLVVVP